MLLEIRVPVLVDQDVGKVPDAVGDHAPTDGGDVAGGLARLA